ncbi:mechanosensitive ion channel [Mucilaginibacter gossypii]|uniref:mechanosensitive ion channel family protein n=1 Tax=Mucilaginibacter gossypii TaxID=551996 RepID=UPI000DCF2B55|nr:MULTISPECIES: mechanosensitive ion channel domain-containing protein [Mucilaginibacter]QTE37581.1 mechanosensitive ion channel [Mucilaginibacter gossypii]RAV58426.1 mechanosensitive ion channel family protein [Mucilaginibacter rubeus]
MKIEKFYDQVYIWVIRYAPSFLIGLVVLFIGLWLINMLLKWWQGHMQKKEIDPTIKPFLQSLVGVVLRVLLILGVVQIMGVPITLFTALVGAFGVAAGLALSGTLQNFASGVLILLLKPFVVGDNIIAQGLEGTVIAIQIFYTIVKTFDNRIVIMPNSKLSNEVIINISREGTRRLDIELKFTNNIDFNEVKSVINSSIDKSKNILETPDRRIGIASLDPDGYRVGVNVWVHAHGFQDTKLAVQENILQDLKASGVKTPGL